MQRHHQQQASHLFNISPGLVTTEQIQKCLDENYRLILAIMDNQKLGRLAESAQYQDQLQKNLMYLAAVADAQPEPQTAPSPQVSQQPTVKQGHLVQHPQSAMAQQKTGAHDEPGLPSKVSAIQLNDHPPEQRIFQFQHQWQQQGTSFQRPVTGPTAGPIGWRIGLNGGGSYHPMQYGFGPFAGYMDSYSGVDGSEAGSSKQNHLGLGSSTRGD
ncbi:hypothetical protein Dimus_000081 [Dionaea muscipula]